MQRKNRVSEYCKRFSDLLIYYYKKVCVHFMEGVIPFPVGKIAKKESEGVRFC